MALEEQVEREALLVDSQETFSHTGELGQSSLDVSVGSNLGSASPNTSVPDSWLRPSTLQLPPMENPF